MTHTLDYNGFPVEIYFWPSDEAMAEVVAEVNAAEESVYFSIFSFTRTGFVKSQNGSAKIFRQGTIFKAVHRFVEKDVWN